MTPKHPVEFDANEHGLIAETREKIMYFAPGEIVFEPDDETLGVPNHGAGRLVIEVLASHTHWKNKPSAAGATDE
ncbi:hypothetical protein OG563_26845 [Nocardia vinacea]|uniref:Uncharacterized protein n=1 Tax=Nocardia vinacea TaxID=96468 RepID=A0ABZ1YKN7_9NOCA|nr:hypothetical protein [Nocardia vinacea]